MPQSNKWASDAMAGAVITWAAVVFVVIAQASEGAAALIAVVLAVLVAPFALVYLVAAGVRLGSKS